MTDGTDMPNPEDPYNLGLISLSLAVGIDRDLGAVTIRDQAGTVSILLNPRTALDLGMRLIGASARLNVGSAS